MGPLLMGLTRPFNVLPRGTDMENVVNVIALTVAQAQGAHLASGSALDNGRRTAANKEPGRRPLLKKRLKRPLRRSLLRPLFIGLFISSR